MTTTDETPVDLSALPITETVDDEIIRPGSLSAETDETPPEVSAPSVSAADRVRARNNRWTRGARDASRADRAPRNIPQKPREGTLIKPLTELYTTIGLMLAPIDPVCSVAFIDNAPACAKAMENLARENETVRRVILALTQTSAWGGALIAHMPILLMVVLHHGPPQVQERVAPLAAMMNPSAMQRAAETEAQRQEGSE